MPSTTTLVRPFFSKTTLEVLYALASHVQSFTRPRPAVGSRGVTEQLACV